MKIALYFQIAMGCLLLLLPGKFQLIGLSVALHLKTLPPVPVYEMMRIWVSGAPWVLIVAGGVALRGKRWGAIVSCVFDGLVAAAAASVFFSLFLQPGRDPFVSVLILGSATVLLIAASVFYFSGMSLWTSRHHET
jgi:hypothetical protein